MLPIYAQGSGSSEAVDARVERRRVVEGGTHKPVLQFFELQERKGMASLGQDDVSQLDASVTERWQAKYLEQEQASLGNLSGLILSATQP